MRHSFLINNYTFVDTGHVFFVKDAPPLFNIPKYESKSNSRNKQILLTFWVPFVPRLGVAPTVLWLPLAVHHCLHRLVHRCCHCLINQPLVSQLSCKMCSNTARASRITSIPQLSTEKKTQIVKIKLLIDLTVLQID